MEDEEQPFLLSEGDGIKVPYQKTRLHGVARHPYFTGYVLVLHVLFLASFLGNVYFYTALIKSFHELSTFPELRLLGHVVDHQHATNHSQYSIYSGPPNVESHKAWEHLMQPLYFNASAAELRETGTSLQDSVRVKDGGYIASLGVYHELHCLNKMRVFLYSHQKTPNMTQEDLSYWYDHLDHCVELLRRSSMCTADLSLFTFSWPTHENAQFLDAHSSSHRRCVDWKQLEAYSWSRKISLAPTLLKPDGNHTSDVL